MIFGEHCPKIRDETEPKSALALNKNKYQNNLRSKIAYPPELILHKVPVKKKIIKTNFVGNTTSHRRILPSFCCGADGYKKLINFFKRKTSAP